MTKYSRFITHFLLNSSNGKSLESPTTYNLSLCNIHCVNVAKRLNVTCNAMTTVHKQTDIYKTNIFTNTKTKNKWTTL